MIGWADGGFAKYFARRKQIETKLNYVMELIDVGEIKVGKVNTVDMIADYWTNLLHPLTMPAKLTVLSCLNFVHFNTRFRTLKGVVVIGPCPTTSHLIIEMTLYVSLRVTTIGED